MANSSPGRSGENNHNSKNNSAFQLARSLFNSTRNNTSGGGMSGSRSGSPPRGHGNSSGGSSVFTPGKNDVFRNQINFENQENIMQAGASGTNQQLNTMNSMGGIANQQQGGSSSSSSSSGAVLPSHAAGRGGQDSANNSNSSAFYKPEKHRAENKESLVKKEVSFAFALVKTFNPADGHTIDEEQFDIDPLPPDSAERKEKERKTRRGTGGSALYGKNRDINSVFNHEDDDSDEFPAISDAFMTKAKSPVKRLPSRIRRDSIGNLAAFFDPMSEESEDLTGALNQANLELQNQHFSGTDVSNNVEKRRVSVISDNSDDVFAVGEEEARRSSAASGMQGTNANINQQERNSDSLFGENEPDKIDHIPEEPEKDEDSFFSGLNTELSSIRQVTGTNDFNQPNITFQQSNSSQHSMHNRARILTPNSQLGTPRSIDGSSKRRRVNNQGSRDITGQVKSMADLIEDMDPGQKNLSDHFDAVAVQQSEEEIRRKSVIKTEGRDLLDDVSSVGDDEECDTPSFGNFKSPNNNQENNNQKTNRHSSRSRGRTFSSIPDDLKNRNSNMLAGNGLKLDSEKARDSQFSSSGWDSSDMNVNRRSSVYSPNQADPFNFQPAPAHSVYGNNNSPAARSDRGELSQSDRNNRHNTSRHSNSLNNSKLDIDLPPEKNSIKVSREVKNALANRPITIIPPDQLAAARNSMDSNLSGRNNNAVQPLMNVENNNRRASRASNEEWDPRRRSASFMIGDVSALNQTGTNSNNRENSGSRMNNSQLNRSNLLSPRANEQIGGATSSRSRVGMWKSPIQQNPNRSLWGISFEEFKERIGVSDADLEKHIIDAIERYKMPLDEIAKGAAVGGAGGSAGGGGAAASSATAGASNSSSSSSSSAAAAAASELTSLHLDAKKRAVGLLPAYPPLSVLQQLNDWQIKSEDLPVVRKLLAANNSATASGVEKEQHEQFVEQLRQIAFLAIEKGVMDNAKQHYDEKLRVFYEKEFSSLEKEIGEKKEKVEKLAVHKEKLAKLLQQKNNIEQTSKAEKARNDRRREEVKNQKEYGKQLEIRIAAARAQVNQRRQNVNHQLEQHSLMTGAASGNNNTTNLNLTSQTTLTNVLHPNAPQPTEQDLKAAKKAIQILQKENESLKKQNERKKLSRDLSKWKKGLGKDVGNKNPDKLFLYRDSGLGHELTFTEGSLRWSFTPRVSEFCPLRLNNDHPNAKNLAKDMYNACWVKSRGTILAAAVSPRKNAPSSPTSGTTTDGQSWLVIFGHRLAQIDRFLKDLGGITGVTFEDHESFLIFHVMVTPSIEVNPYGFSEVYPTPGSTKRAYWMFDLRLPRSELIRFAAHIHDVDWISKLQCTAKPTPGVDQKMVQTAIDDCLDEIKSDTSAAARASRSAPGAIRSFLQSIYKQVKEKMLRDLKHSHPQEHQAYLRHKNSFFGQPVAGMQLQEHPQAGATSLTSMATNVGYNGGGSSGVGSMNYSRGGMTGTSSHAGNFGTGDFYAQSSRSHMGGSMQGRGVSGTSSSFSRAGHHHPNASSSRAHPYSRPDRSQISSPERSVLQMLMPTSAEKQERERHQQPLVH